MQFLDIQSLLKSQINFSQFGVKDLTAEEKDMLVLFLQGKIINTNKRFEKLINNEKLSMILTILNEDEETNIKKEIINIIKKLDMLTIFAKIQKEDLDMYKIINKYFKDIKELLHQGIDLVLSNKYVTLYIQYILSFDEYNNQDIINTIQKIKNIIEMETENMMAIIEDELLNMDFDDIEENEEEELMLEQEINQLMSDMSIEGVEHKEDSVIYISSLEKYEDMISIFRKALQFKFNLIPFFQRLVKPTFLEQYVSIDILKTLIETVIKDEKISQSLKQFILQSIVSFMTYKE